VPYPPTPPRPNGLGAAEAEWGWRGKLVVAEGEERGEGRRMEGSMPPLEEEPMEGG